jgi:hypothetical protein
MCSSSFAAALRPVAGLPDFYWYNIPKREKIYQMAIK